MKHAIKTPSPHASTLLFQIDGALHGLADDYSAAGNRTARYVLNITAGWEQAEQGSANIAWARDA